MLWDRRTVKSRIPPESRTRWGFLCLYVQYTTEIFPERVQILQFCKNWVRGRQILQGAIRAANRDKESDYVIE